jgi:putative spermidine/putrescine transport system substrate-binding protein
VKKIAMLGLSIVLGACSGQASPTAAPSATTSSLPAASPIESPAAVPSGALDKTWDQVVTAAKAEGQVTFYAWWGEDFWKAAAQNFKDKYGIDAKVVIGDAAIDKALAEIDRPAGTIDVLLIGGRDVKTAIDANVWYGPIFAKMPSTAVLDQKLASYQEGVATNGYLVPIYRNQTGFLYDPDRVPSPPQTWAEFTAWVDANPKGFAYPDPNKGGTGQAFVQTVIANLTGGIDKYKGDTAVDAAKIANWNLAWDWLKANNSKINVTLSNNEDVDLLNQGAAKIVMAWDDDTLAALAKGTLFKRATMYIPTLGLAGGGDTAGVIKNAPHKAAALLFIDFLTSMDTQILMNKTVGSIPARGDITNLPSVIPEDQRQNNSTPWMPAPYKDAYIKGFTSNVLLH